jgi:hypothetical protein
MQQVESRGLIKALHGLDVAADDCDTSHDTSS